MKVKQIDFQGAVRFNIVAKLVGAVKRPSDVQYNGAPGQLLLQLLGDV